MSFLDHIIKANSHDMDDYLPWFIGPDLVGYVRHDLAEQLADYGGVFILGPDRLDLAPRLRSADERSDTVEAVLADLRSKGLIARVHGEAYSVAVIPRGQELMYMDRAAVTPFGTVNEGFHLNGYVRKADGIHMWIARRSATKRSHPGMLDNMVAGGQPRGISVAENVLKECKEEADIPADIAGMAKPVGAIAYKMTISAGLRRHIMYTYDLEVGEDFVPRPFDGEVDEFMLLPLAEVAGIVRDTEEFKYNCNIAIIDFLIRHGHLKPDDPDYVRLVTELKRPLF